MLHEAWSIRPALTGDAQAIAEVHVKSWQTSYAGIFPETLLSGLSVEERTRRWRDILAARGPMSVTLLGCDADGAIVGFVDGGKERTGELAGDSEIYAIYLRQEAQRQGLGTLLVRRFAQEMNIRGFVSMAVWLLALNPSGKFYEALGGGVIAQRNIEVGGQSFAEIAYGWRDLSIFEP